MYTEETWYIVKNCVIQRPGMKDIFARAGDRVTYKLLPDTVASSFGGTVERSMRMSEYGYLLSDERDYEVDV